MKIALIGYGKMGKAIEQIALKRGHSIVARIDKDSDLNELFSQNPTVAIEFSSPETGFDNIQFCIKNNIPIVSGTTGWLEKYDEMVTFCKQQKGAFFYASNYSIGVNLFFELNKHLARLMTNFLEYNSEIEEIHHTQKLDAPSGTAITLAEGIIKNNTIKQQWINSVGSKKNSDLSIISKRIDKVPGTHTILYNSDVDAIEIKHTAHSREGFATGAVVAAEFLNKKTGVFGMNDLLKL